MNSLTAKASLPQLRGIPVMGSNKFRYERMVSGKWVPCNHSEAIAAVGEWRLEMKRLCASLTGFSGTGGVMKCGSSGGKRNVDALYTFAKGTIMSASALLNNSCVNLQN